MDAEDQLRKLLRLGTLVVRQRERIRELELALKQSREELQRLKIAARHDLPYDAMGGYEL